MCDSCDLPEGVLRNLSSVRACVTCLYYALRNDQESFGELMEHLDVLDRGGALGGMSAWAADWLSELVGSREVATQIIEREMRRLAAH